MHRNWPALVVLLSGIARGQAPAYSAAGFVNAANFAPGPFAANSVVTLFGSNLCTCPSGAVSAQQNSGGSLPMTLGNVSVYVQWMSAPLLYVSATQINFLIPVDESPGSLPVYVARQGVSGPVVSVVLVAGAPALFPSPNGYALAEDWNNSYAVITPDVPAHAGNMVVLYATGLGSAIPNTTGQVPSRPVLINNPIKVTLGGVALDPVLIKYAGLTPGFAGLYQINLILPDNPGTDPEIRVFMGDQASPAGLKLAVR